MSGERLPSPSLLWESGRASLLAIKWEAARRIASPWAVLCMALARSLLTIPYPVRYRSALHPEGTPLNMAYAIVGRSGAGKSTALHAATVAVAWEGEHVPEMTTARSGEGIPALLAYTRPEKKGDAEAEAKLHWRSVDHAIWAHWEEVGMLAAQGARSGSTVLESIKSMTSGERLGGQNARGDGLTIPAGQYRAVLTVAAQPRRSAAILDDTAVAGGFAARFLWFLAESPEAAAMPRPSLSTDTHVAPLGQWDNVRFVDALPAMDAAHEADTRRAHLGERDPINSRRVLNRALIAVALANMDGRAALIPEDWDLAGSVIAHSDETLSHVRDAVAEPDPEEESKRARVEASIMARVADLRGRGIAWRSVNAHITASQRAVFGEMVRAGLIERW